MSLLNSATDIIRIGIKEGMRYRASVIENKDPKQLGRIKFRIPDFFDFSIEDSPWAIPLSNGADGATNKSGVVSIPRIDSFVDIEFRAGSVYHPAYLPTTIFESVYLEKSRINYPERHLIEMQNGCYVFLDERTGLVEFFNPGDVRIIVHGSVSMEVKGTFAGSVDGNATIIVNKGDLAATATEGTVTVEATNNMVMVKGKNLVSVQADNIQLQGKSGASDLAGVVTGASICAFSGRPHSDYSQEVFASTGGV